jgi:hypothetical protein
MKQEAEIGSQIPGKTWPSVRGLVLRSLEGNCPETSLYNFMTTDLERKEQTRLAAFLHFTG